MMDIDYLVVINGQIIQGSIYLPLNHTLSQHDIDELIKADAQLQYDSL